MSRQQHDGLPQRPRRFAVDRRDTSYDDPPERRKASVLAETTAAKTNSIADAAVLKDLDLFMVLPHDAQVPMEEGHAFGLYHRDCRYLSGYEIRFAGKRLQPLAASTHRGWEGRFQLSNRQLQCVDGASVDSHELAITLERRLDGTRLVMEDTLRVHNFGDVDLRLPVTIALAARFEDIFAVRGQMEQPSGEQHDLEVGDGRIEFSYTGIDDVERRLSVNLPEGAREVDHEEEHSPAGTMVEVTANVPAHGSTDLCITMQVDDRSEDETEASRPTSHTSGRSIDSTEAGPMLDFDADDGQLCQTVRQAVRDVTMLTGSLDGRAYVMAGVPWFGTLFGRDSLVIALQLMAFNPELAADTAHLLAAWQGEQHDDWRDEEPGKVLHELRHGELTASGVLPYSPYYGTVDATPLFLLAVAEHARVTGSTSLLEDLREPVRAALDWTTRRADATDHGFIEYASEIASPPIQKGWRDSTNGIVTADGGTAEPPIALIEVQAYAWRAWVELADLLDRVDGSGHGDELRRRAASFRERVHERFRSERLDGMFGLAIWGDDHQLADAATSNPGHALWCGLADDDAARDTARRLLRQDMFNGWGVRTLASSELGYNPVSYHRGSVWPHDNAICALGLRRYGFDEEALRICNGMLAAASHFDEHRLPELFSGHGRAEFSRPVRYPVACHPQGWAAGAVPMLLQACAGMHVDGFDGIVRFERPMLPGTAHYMDLHGIRAGDGRLSVRLERRQRDEPWARVHVLEVEGDIDVRAEEA